MNAVHPSIQQQQGPALSAALLNCWDNFVVASLGSFPTLFSPGLQEWLLAETPLATSLTLPPDRLAQ